MDKLHEKTKSSEVILNGRFLKVWRDIVELPDGHTSFREYIKHPGAACVVPVLDNGNLILVRQFRYSVKQVFYEFPAGKRDSKESTLETAHRELEEEVGFQASQMDFLTKIHPVIGYSNEEIDLYLATGLKKTQQRLDPGEKLEVIEMSPQELKSLIFQGQVSDVKTQIAAFWYFDRNPVK
ncbi:MAG: NUDIX domain-containing protein [Pseudobdellovibrionaceae bacterium]